MGTLTVPCKHCQKEVSIEAETCPHCGAKKPAAKDLSPRAKIVIFLVALVVVYIFFKAVC